MIPHLVKGTVYVSPYMGDTYSTEDIRIVMANDDEDARLKYEDYWNDKTDEYSVYYRVNCTVMETVF
jgi:hypothetical protein